MADEQSKNPVNSQKGDNQKTEESFKELISGIQPIKRKLNRVSRFSETTGLSPSFAQNPELNKRSSIKQTTPEPPTTLSTLPDCPPITYESLKPETRLEHRDFSISLKQMRSLKAGKTKVQAILDLHGHTKSESEELVMELFQRYHQCTVLIIHGKGYNSENKEATLKSWLNYFLKQHYKVRAYCSANNQDGGTGAVYVLLK